MLDISTQNGQWRDVALFSLTAASIAACLLFAHALLFPIVAAVTLAIVTRPISVWMRSRMSATLTAVAMVALLALVLFVPMTFLIKHLVKQAIHLVQRIQAGDLDDFLVRLSLTHPRFGATLQQGLNQLDPDAHGKQVAAWIAPRLGQGLQVTVSGIVRLVLGLFFYFFLVRDEQAAIRAFEAFLPMSSQQAATFSRKLAELIDAVFAGRVLIAMLQGAASGIAYRIAGVHGALLWGTVTFLCCLIPAFGAFLAWVPITLYVGFAHSWMHALLLAIWCAGVVSTMDNFLYPVFVGRKTDLHTAVIFVAIFGGLAFFGISGFVLGPVLVASAIFFLQIWQSRADGEAAL